MVSRLMMKIMYFFIWIVHQHLILLKYAVLVHVYACPHSQADIDVFPELWIKETEEELEERRTGKKAKEKEVVKVLDKLPTYRPHLLGIALTHCGVWFPNLLTPVL